MGGDKRVDSDRDSELELDYNHCKLMSLTKKIIILIKQIEILQVKNYWYEILFNVFL